MTAILILADRAADVSSAAWLTLAVPVVVTVIALAVLYLVLRRVLMTPAPPAAASPQAEAKAARDAP